jgi:hypothetical protein
VGRFSSTKWTVDVYLTFHVQEILHIWIQGCVAVRQTGYGVLGGFNAQGKEMWMGFICVTTTYNVIK